MVVCFLSVQAINNSQTKKPYLCLLQAIALVGTDVPLFCFGYLGQVPISAGAVLVCNMAVTLILCWTYPILGPQFAKWIRPRVVDKKSWPSLISPLTASPLFTQPHGYMIDVSGALFRFIVVSKWVGWSACHFGSASLGVVGFDNLPKEYSILIAFVGLAAWAWSGLQYLRAATVFDLNNSKSTLLLPIEIGLLYHTLLLPWLVTARLSVLKYRMLVYRLLLNGRKGGFPAKNSNKRFSPE